MGSGLLTSWLPGASQLLRGGAGAAAPARPARAQGARACPAPGAFFAHCQRSARPRHKAVQDGNNVLTQPVLMETDDWIACDRCQKWRRVPAEVAAQLGEGEEWYAACAGQP